jgi:hypothetical protein
MHVAYVACWELPPKTVSAAWDADPDPSVTGYNLYYGKTAGQETALASTGSATTQTISLASGYTYFFVVKAHNSAGAESLPSNEVSVAL